MAYRISICLSVTSPATRVWSASAPVPHRSAAVVMADVGRGSVVGAGSVVTAPLPDYVVAAGIPAKVLRSRKSTAQLA